VQKIKFAYAEKLKKEDEIKKILASIDDYVLGELGIEIPEGGQNRSMRFGATRLSATGLIRFTCATTPYSKSSNQSIHLLPSETFWLNLHNTAQMRELSMVFNRKTSAISGSLT